MNAQPTLCVLFLFCFCVCFGGRWRQSQAKKCLATLRIEFLRQNAALTVQCAVRSWQSRRRVMARSRAISVLRLLLLVGLSWPQKMLTCAWSARSSECNGDSSMTRLRSSSVRGDRLLHAQMSSRGATFAIYQRYAQRVRRVSKQRRASFWPDATICKKLSR